MFSQVLSDPANLFQYLIENPEHFCIALFFLGALNSILRCLCYMGSLQCALRTVTTHALVAVVTWFANNYLYADPGMCPPLDLCLDAEPCPELEPCPEAKPCPDPSVIHFELWEISTFWCQGNWTFPLYTETMASFTPPNFSVSADIPGVEMAVFLGFVNLVALLVYLWRENYVLLEEISHKDRLLESNILFQMVQVRDNLLDHYREQQRLLLLEIEFLEILEEMTREIHAIEMSQFLEILEEMTREIHAIVQEASGIVLVEPITLMAGAEIQAEAGATVDAQIQAGAGATVDAQIQAGAGATVDAQIQAEAVRVADAEIQTDMSTDNLMPSVPYKFMVALVTGLMVFIRKGGTLNPVTESTLLRPEYMETRLRRCYPLQILYKGKYKTYFTQIIQNALKIYETFYEKAQKEIREQKSISEKRLVELCKEFLGSFQ